MALTVTTVRKSQIGPYRCVVADVAFDTSYATGGSAITAQQLGLNTISHMDSSHAVKSDKTLAAPVTYFRTGAANNAGVLVVYGTAGSAGGLTEIANATNLSTYTARCAFYGNV